MFEKQNADKRSAIRVAADAYLALGKNNPLPRADLTIIDEDPTSALMKADDYCVRLAVVRGEEFEKAEAGAITRGGDKGRHGRCRHHSNELTCFPLSSRCKRRGTTLLTFLHLNEKKCDCS